MHPTTPMSMPSLRRLKGTKLVSRPKMRASAFSRTAHVLRMTTSASSRVRAGVKPFCVKMPIMSSLSAVFIWQPYVSMSAFMRLRIAEFFCDLHCKPLNLNNIFRRLSRRSCGRDTPGGSGYARLAPGGASLAHTPSRRVYRLRPPPTGGVTAPIRRAFLFFLRPLQSKIAARQPRREAKPLPAPICAGLRETAAQRAKKRLPALCFAAAKAAPAIARKIIPSVWVLFDL